MAVPRQDKNLPSLHRPFPKGRDGGGGFVNTGKSTYPLEQMDFPLLFEGVLTHSHQSQTSLLILKRK